MSEPDIIDDGTGDWGEREEPDIDEILQKFALHNSMGIQEVKKAIYSLLAAEAVDVEYDHEFFKEEGKAIPLSKLKAIMEIKE